MKRFISFILLILLCFIFFGGVSFAGIVPVVGQKIEQAAISPSLTDNNTMELTSALDSIIINDNCRLVLSQKSTMLFDRQNIINTIKAKHTAIKADGTIAAEIGTVLKCPIRDKPVV